MIIAVYIIAVVILFYLGYIISLYSGVAYVEPERMEQMVKNLSGLKRKYWEAIRVNPRVSLQLATVFKSVVLVLSSVLTILTVGKIAQSLLWKTVPAMVIGLVIIWVLYLIFLEILPSRRVLSLAGDELRYLSLYIVIYFLFKPLLIVYGRIFAHEKNGRITEDQKEDIIERAIETLAEQAGIDEPIVEDDEKEMIGQIFQLDVTEVREVMVPRINIKGFPKTATLEEIRSLTREAGFSRYPVFDESPDRVVGILYVKDLFTALNNDNVEMDLMRLVRQPLYVSEKKKISELLAEFKANKVHIAIVVDEYGGTSGLVTLEDILEEIVGEIQDEHDHEAAPLVRLSDNSLRVDAAVPIEELLEELKLEYDIGDFETVGGLLYDLYGSVPSPGTTLKWKDIIFEVDRVEGQRIVSVKTWVKKGTEI